MTLYRLICRFEPGHPRLAGTRTDSTARRGQSPRYRRGAWRVVDSYAALSESDIPLSPMRGKGLNLCGPYPRYPDPVFAHAQELYTLALRRLAPGTLCNPHRLLNELIKDRHAPPH